MSLTLLLNGGVNNKSTVSELLDNCTSILDLKSITNTFNDYFVEIGRFLTTSITNLAISFS